MIWVGLTGGIASGKTTVANFLREMAIPVVDADQLAHLALAKNKKKIITYFGQDVVGENGEIDRRALGAKVFGDSKIREKLENMIHPFVQEKVAEKRRLFGIGGSPIAVYDVPLLFEKNLEEQFDHILLVYVPEAESKKRLMERNGLSEAEAELRISNQMDIEEKKAKANSVLDNQGDRDALKSQVMEWKNSLLGLKGESSS